MLFYEDSIFSGCDASSMYNREPFMPYMHKLIESALASRSAGRVQVDNLAVGGWTVENGRDALFCDVGGHDYSKSYKGYDLYDTFLRHEQCLYPGGGVQGSDS